MGAPHKDPREPRELRFLRDEVADTGLVAAAVVIDHENRARLGFGDGLDEDVDAPRVTHR